VDRHGRDGRARLLHEAYLATRVHGEVPLPAPLGLFATGGDLVGVQEYVTGTPLRRWVRQRAGAGAGLPVELALGMAQRLRSLVSSIHAAGLVLRDLGPDRVLVRPNGEPMLRDLAGAADTGSMLAHRGTPGYTAPELGTRHPPPAAPAEDLYGLGALLFFLVTGNDPVLAADAPAQRPVCERLEGWLSLVARYNDAARILRPAILTLVRPEPGERGELSQLDRLLAGGTSPHPRGSGDGLLPRARALPTADDLLADGLDHLTCAMCPDEQTLWPLGGAVRTDPETVRDGAAGVLAVLLRAHTAKATDDIAPLTVEAAARKAASWLSARCRPLDTEALGLLHGQAGVAWVLTDASAVLGEPYLHALAEHLALALPTSGPDPGLAGGLAGAALLQLRLARLTGQRRWRRQGDHPSARTRHDGDSRFCDRAAAYAASLRAAAVPGLGGPTWPVGPTGARQTRGSSSDHVHVLRGRLGLTHGIAGIGYALLAVGTALGDSSLVTLAGEAGYTLCRAARIDDDGAAWWHGEDPDVALSEPHRCDGPAGIGTFLLRLAAVTGEQRFGEYARAAAGAVHRARWTSRPGACHGLAGDGEFLLDAAGYLADDTYRVWAEDLVPLLAVRHCRRDGRVLLPDESLRDVSAGYSGGLAGTLAFLLRLRHGGSRLFLVDELLTEDPAPAPDLNRYGWPGHLGELPSVAST
jgi:hypothetical protein